MPRGTVQERETLVAQTFIENGMKYAPVGRKHGRLFTRGGNRKNEQSIASNTGKEIVMSSGVQRVLSEMLPKEGEETRKYVRKKLYAHAENQQNPHISLKAVEIMAKTEAMLTDRVQMDATTRNMDVYVDYTEQKRA